MTACDITNPAPRTERTEADVPPEDVIAILAHFYCVAGLHPKAAWRSALADYECFFRGVTSVES
jgi:hypothetical protein